MGKIKTINPKDFLKLDLEKVTLLDLRNPEDKEEEFSHAINMPFGEIFTKIWDVPKENPVYVICDVGDWSAEVTEILISRGYDAYNLEGGIKELNEYRQGLIDCN